MKNIVAIDTEFERRYTYRPILSIVQICKPNGEPKIYDVFKQPNESLVELIEILSNDNIIKIIHLINLQLKPIAFRVYIARNYFYYSHIILHNLTSVYAI